MPSAGARLDSNSKDRSGKQDQSGLEKTQRETVAAENRWSFPGVGTVRKGACMARPSMGPSGVAAATRCLGVCYD